ncbi:MAG: 23S rRNA (adenine(2503)-C(2))-methyltransferase RlmN, partial [Myxococcales bacterium]|nr:23S rRNA (adenine(2503)-C(2))-methyltransferase RlmN [Myxococcales bacterium]
MNPDLLGTPRDRLGSVLVEAGVGVHHTARVFGGLHRRRLPARDIPDLGHAAARLAEGTWTATADVVHEAPSDDGTTRLVLTLHDGARIEAVLVPMAAGRHTLCVSTQVGCAMACTFCATGTLGLTRHLSAGEIVAQVHAARRHAAARGARITRLVFMGMG